DLLAGKRLRDEVEAGAAVLLRDDDAEQAEVGHALDHAQIEVVVDVVLDRVRKDALLHELAHRVLEQTLLVGQLEVHAPESMSERTGTGALARARRRAWALHTVCSCAPA